MKGCRIFFLSRLHKYFIDKVPFKSIQDKKISIKTYRSHISSELILNIIFYAMYLSSDNSDYLYVTPSIIVKMTN